MKIFEHFYSQINTITKGSASVRVLFGSAYFNDVSLPSCFK